MKKILNLLMLFVLMSSAGMARVSAKDNFRQTTTQQTQVQTKENASPTKKDGTPDKRFKANKKPKPIVIPLKKDGTPDNRYKVNKSKNDAVKS